MKFFITGGSGFIGSSLMHRLIEDKDNSITIYDNFERDSYSNDEILSKNKRIDKVKGDILDYNYLRDMLRFCSPDIVIHMAAVAGVDNVLKRPVRTMEVNTIGSYNILKAIIKSKDRFNLKKFINFSTSEIYGDYANSLSEDEKTSMGAVGEARWSYAISKLCSEHLTYAFNVEHKIPFISIRPFNIYGPRQVGEGAIHVFIRKILNNENIEIHGDGSQIRSWCYIDDAIDFIKLCIDNRKANNNVFNMGNRDSTISILDLAKLIIDISGSKSEIKFINKDYADVELRIANIEKGIKLLDYKPKVDLREGIEKTIEWYKGMYKNE